VPGVHEVEDHRCIAIAVKLACDQRAVARRPELIRTTCSAEAP
jgi:hypothetical protein